MMWSIALLAVSTICLCHQAHMARYLNYQRKAMLDDFIPTHGSLYTGLTRSKIECSIRCESVTGIQSFFYVHNTNACECYGTSYATSDGLSSVPSAKYYEKQEDINSYIANRGFGEYKSTAINGLEYSYIPYLPVMFKTTSNILDCDDPPGVDNATVTSGAIVQGSERSYTCNVGYSDISNASMNLTCQQDGTWTEVAFECVQDCVAPTIVVNAVVSPGATMQGSERLYTCNAGYSDINNALRTVTCQQDGTWTAVEFQCVQDCAEPSFVDNAAVSPGATMQGSERSYTCNNGYSEINNALMTVTCQQDGTWTTVAFECAQDCNEPLSVDNASVSPGAIVQGSVRFYTCNLGYLNINNAPMTVTCQQGGTWTAVAFGCVQDTVCPPDSIDFHQAVLQDGTVIQIRAFLDAQTDFNGAMTTCAAVGGSLYQILTLEKMSFTLQLMTCPVYQSYDFWIDAMFNVATTVWETTAGTPLPMNQTDFWAPTRPKSSGQGRCASMDALHGYKWDDKSCGVLVYALCEMF